jgi:para-aminobenzoate synthetase/4-amino-4-deoxychorismate lyase
MNLTSVINKVLSQAGSALFYTPSFYDESKSYLFTNPDLIITSTKENFFDTLNKVDYCTKDGLSGFGLIDYEAGYLLEKRLEKLLPDVNQPLIRFFFFDKSKVEVIDSGSIDLFDNDQQNSFEINNYRLSASKEKFINALSQIHNYIEEGDTYQVNYTIKGKFDFKGDYASFFKKLIFNQSARYIAFINYGDSIVISLSPELFFEVNNGFIRTRPMKGTIHRGINNQADSLNIYTLRNSEKNRAENLMILDLLRNDLGRISKFGTVRARKIFTVEKYETLLQMVSEVESELRDEINFSDIIKNIFPCGSVTGAPKIRTMEIIKELEEEPRGIYTGAIGLIHHDIMKFNVAIRTLKINAQTRKGEFGIGSGIVWDSQPEKEYEEVILKSNFLLHPLPYFELFETMKYKNGTILRFSEHLERLKEAASYFLFKYDREKLLSFQSPPLEDLGGFRMILNKNGEVKFEHKVIEELPKEIKIIISGKIISTQNRFQYFKTTNRELYNKEHSFYSLKGFYDVIFINEKNQVAEGAISNIFIKKGGLWYTPPVSSGILPGVFRKYWLRKDINVKEDVLYKDDLLIADEIVLTNSIRGKVRVDKLYINENEFKEFLVSTVK